MHPYLPTASRASTQQFVVGGTQTGYAEADRDHWSAVLAIHSVDSELLLRDDSRSGVANPEQEREQSDLEEVDGPAYQQRDAGIRERPEEDRDGSCNQGILPHYVPTALALA